MKYNSISFIRKEGEFTLHGGMSSNIFWDVEALYAFKTYKERIKILKPWLREIKKLNPSAVIGIPKGGLMLAHDVANYLKLPLYTPRQINENAIIVDDVMTTGSTLSECMEKTGKVKAIAILINRSPLIKYNNTPIISGIFADEIDYDKETDKETAE